MHWTPWKTTMSDLATIAIQHANTMDDSTWDPVVENQCSNSWAEQVAKRNELHALRNITLDFGRKCRWCKISTHIKWSYKMQSARIKMVSLVLFRILYKVYGVTTRVWILVQVKVVSRQAKWTQYQIPQVLEFSHHLLL